MPKTQKPKMVDVIEEVFQEIGVLGNRPKHVDEFGPIVAARWRKLGYTITKNIDRQINSALQSESSDSKKPKSGPFNDRFQMHGEGYWSLRKEPSLDRL
jgi:hypothetical protein